MVPSTFDNALRYQLIRYRAEERKAALRAAATGTKDSGKSVEVFPDSKYAMPEDKSPNVHTRQASIAMTAYQGCLIPQES